MTAEKVAIWSVGVVIALAGVIAGLVFGDLGRMLVIPGALLVLGCSALVNELSQARLSAKNSPRPGPPIGALPADGFIDIVPMTKVEGKVHPLSPQFQAYRAILDHLGDPVQVRSLPVSRSRLLGRVALISVFVGRDRVAWTEAEIADGLDAVKRAGLWLEREAKSSEAWLNVEMAEIYFEVQDDEPDEVEVAFAPEGNDFGPMEAHASTKAMALASRAAAALGFTDIVDLMERINTRLETDSRVWLFHLRRSGRSLAIPVEDSEIDGIGLAVCYASEANFPEALKTRARVDPTTVVHELLHLFGASDKYGTTLDDYPPMSVTDRDIMRLSDNRLSRMTIDALTASEIGWPLRNIADRP